MCVCVCMYMCVSCWLGERRGGVLWRGLCVLSININQPPAHVRAAAVCTRLWQIRGPDVPLLLSMSHCAFSVCVCVWVCVSKGLLADAGGRARPVPPAVSEPQTRWPANWSAPRTVPVLSKIKADELDALRPSAGKYKYQLPLVSVCETAICQWSWFLSLLLLSFALTESYGTSICRDETQRKTQEGGKDLNFSSHSKKKEKKKCQLPCTPFSSNRPLNRSPVLPSRLWLEGVFVCRGSVAHGNGWKHLHLERFHPSLPFARTHTHTHVRIRYTNRHESPDD